MIVFFISNNKIKSWDEVAKLGGLAEIKSVLMTGNPVYQDRSSEENAPIIIKRVP